MNPLPVARKATHKGTCQVCGCTQKLPSGRLSTHGYTVKWGFFSGTCHGTNALPFELDCSLIAASVASAEAQLVGTKNSIASLLSGAHADEHGAAWFNTFVEASHSYRWEWCHVFGTEVKFSDGVGSYTTFSRTTKFTPRSKFDVTPEGHRKIQTYIHRSTVADVVSGANSAYVQQVLAPRVAQLEEYIRWQTGRIASWAPHPEKLIAL